MERVVCKGGDDYFYMKTTLEFADDSFQVDGLLFKAIIVKALLSMYGEVGAATVVDVLKYDEDTGRAILRVQQSGFGKLWSALTLYCKYGQQECAFRIKQVSSCLMALAVNSREDQYE